MLLGMLANGGITYKDLIEMTYDDYRYVKSRAEEMSKKVTDTGDKNGGQ
jgi:hypothetical protein